VSRLLRFIPDGGSLVEVTCRSIHSRLLLRPGHPLNEIIIGALARSKRLYGVRIVCFSFVSNHFHLLLEVDDARQLSRFMGYFASKLAKEVGRLTGWREKIFGRRYQAILVSPEERAQALRAAYAEFLAAFRRAAERLKKGQLNVRFPQGSFPPPLPFVGG
jgi:hypothetical protein